MKTISKKQKYRFDRMECRFSWFASPQPIAPSTEVLGTVRFYRDEESDPLPGVNIASSKLTDPAWLLVKCCCGKPMIVEWCLALGVTKGRKIDEPRKVLHCGCVNNFGFPPSIADVWLQSLPVRQWPRKLKEYFVDYLHRNGRLRQFIPAAMRSGEQLKYLRIIAPISTGDPVYMAHSTPNISSPETTEKSPLSGFICQCRCGRQVIVRQHNLRDEAACGCRRLKKIPKTAFGKLKVLGVCEWDVIPITPHRWLCECRCGAIVAKSAAEIHAARSQNLGCGIVGCEA